MAGFNLREGLLPGPRGNNSSGVWLSSNGTAIKRGRNREERGGRGVALLAPFKTFYRAFFKRALT